MAHLEYIKYSNKILHKAELTLSLLTKKTPDEPRLENLKYHIAHGLHQIKLIYRRVIEHEQIPHSEKVFSIFEPHTEWISKGKAGTPVELGLRVCVLQDQFGFTLNHHVVVGLICYIAWILTPNSILLISKPMTISCILSSFEKQIVFLANRLIQVRKFRFLRSIF